jgi:hypothetical protein
MELTLLIQPVRICPRACFRVRAGDHRFQANAFIFEGFDAPVAWVKGDSIRSYFILDFIPFRDTEYQNRA